MKKIHYSWFICVGCFLLLFCVAGLGSTAFSVYQPYLISIKGFTNFQASAVVFVRNLFCLIGMTAITPFLNKVSIRLLVTGSMLICCAAFLVFALSPGFYTFCIGSALAGLAMGCGGTIPGSIIISRWFYSHRGLALGICMSATGLATFISSPVIAAVIDAFSFTTALIAESVFILLMTILVYAILRSRPACLHLEPLGARTAAQNAGAEGNAAAASKTADEDHAASDDNDSTDGGYAKQTAPYHLYILMCLGILVFGTTANNVFSHLSVLYSNEGFSDAQASWVLSIFGIALAAGKCAYGQISDRIGVFRASCLMYTLVLIGTGIQCMAAVSGYGLALAGALLSGLGLAITSVAATTFAGQTASKEDYPRVVARFQLMNTLGGLIFATVPGLLADVTGSYVPAFVVMFFTALVSSVLLLATYRTICRKNSL